MQHNGTDHPQGRGELPPIRIRDHAPATSQGTYLVGPDDFLESLEDYQTDGYHPIHLGDSLGASGRYTVLHKLGSGGFGTVWLCRDSASAGYVAVKVMTGDMTEDRLRELELAKLDRSSPGAEHIVYLLDHFTLQGPNGTHHCLVLPVLGPCVSPHLWEQVDADPNGLLRNMARQATEALAFLHSNGLCHGDFRPANILVRLTSLDHLSEDELFAQIGRPRRILVKTETGEAVPPSQPKYLVAPADMSGLGSAYLTDKIGLIDFGECFPLSSPPQGLGIPENYLPPEVLFLPEPGLSKDGDEEDGLPTQKEEVRASAIGPACDLWALGCTLFEIRKQIPLFYMLGDRDDLLEMMVRLLGKLPEDMWSQWEAKGDFFDEQGKPYWVKEDVNLEAFLKVSYEFTKRDTGITTRLALSEAEKSLLADLVRRLLRYNPKERPSADEILAHDWFHFRTE